ncbi:MAG: dTDP-4-dehydrorhamnose reductase [bacterium]
MKKILITGAKGMLGQDLTEILAQQDFIISFPTDIDTLDIIDEKALTDYFDNNNFDMVIHAAAYTDVDGAESNQDKAFLINYKGTENLARQTARINIPIVYISTDYVFDGTKNFPYEPDDKPNPINIYGLSKLKGEEAIQKFNQKYYIARTSWLYGHKGRNFVETIINLAKQKPELKIVNDQTGCPTWTIDLISGILSLIDENKPYGIYHICGSGCTSWYGFALKIIEFMKLKTKILPISTKEFPRPAKRPEYSVMNNNQICPNWEKSLFQYIKKYKEGKV